MSSTEGSFTRRSLRPGRIRVSGERLDARLIQFRAISLNERISDAFHGGRGRGNYGAQSARIEKERKRERTRERARGAFIRRVTLRHGKALLSTAETRFKARLPLKLPRTKLSPRHPKPILLGNPSAHAPLSLFFFLSFFLSLSRRDHEREKMALPCRPKKTDDIKARNKHVFLLLTSWSSFLPRSLSLFPFFLSLFLIRRALLETSVLIYILVDRGFCSSV